MAVECIKQSPHRLYGFATPLNPPSSSSPPTEQQAAALEAAGSVVLSSGAGCGKTFVLTRRFLGYLEEFSVGEIVAITFTERAARDMRDRIRQAIRDRMATEPDGRWAEHLRDLESATITTIHSFCGNLVRQHAIQLGIDPGFEILEEMLSVNLMDDSIRRSLQELVIAKSDLGDDCRQLVIIYGWSETIKCVTNLIGQRDYQAWDEWVLRSASHIADDWANRARDLLAAKVTDFFARNPKWIRLRGLLEVHASTNAKVRIRLADLKGAIDRLDQSASLHADLRTIRESAKIHNERAKAWSSDDVYKVMQEAIKDFRDAFDETFGKLPKEDDKSPDDRAELEVIAKVALQFMRVAIKVGKDFQAVKQRAGVLDFDDLIALALRLLSQNEDARKRVRERHQRLLLDEMQDTDPVQMAVIGLLAGDSRIERRLFAVGDIKQSIYRFRGAEVGLFASLRESVPEANRLPLTANFRSQAPILEFVNTLFAPVFREYEPLTTTAPPILGEPCVEFWWSFLGEEKAGAGELRELEARTIARRLRRMIEEGRPLIARKGGQARAMAMGDIVLLFRSMSNVPVYEEALRAEGLDYYIVGGRAFFAQQEVYDILNLLKALENPDDAISLIGVLRSPFGCLSDESLLILGRHKQGLWEGLAHEETLAGLSPEQRERVKRIAGELRRWQKNKDRLPIARLLREIMEESGYDAALQLESMGDRKLANLWKLMEMARTFDRHGMFHLSDFIRQLSAMVSRELREEQAATQPENADVIRLMSVHQSKGLEFPVVVLPELASRKNSGLKGKTLWDRELGCVVKPPEETPPLFGDFAWDLAAAREKAADREEEQRIFYVATTRAKDLLILSGSFAEAFPTDVQEGEPLPLKLSNPWIETLHAQFHLATGETIDPARRGDSPLVRVRTESPFDEPGKPRREKKTAEPIIDERKRDATPHQPSVLDWDDLFPAEPDLPEKIKQALGEEVDWTTGDDVFSRHELAGQSVQIRGKFDGFAGEAALVIDHRDRGVARLGLVALANPDLSLKLFNLDNQTLESVDPGEAMRIAGNWLQSASLKINANAE